MNTMTPSETISNGQIGKVQDLLGDALRKSGLAKEPTQSVIENQGAELAAKLVGLVRTFVEAVSNLIARSVKVDRARTPKQVLDATGRVQYTDKDVVENMPKGSGDGAEVIFFNLGRSVSDTDLDKEYELRGLVPADPYSLAKVNEDDPAFADNHPNGTHWKNADGKWCFAAFSCGRYGGRNVRVRRDGFDWGGDWWFGGLRKIQS